MNKEKIIKGLYEARRYLEDKEWSDENASPHIDSIIAAIELLKNKLNCEKVNIVNVTLYKKLIRPMHCHPRNGQDYTAVTDPVEKEEIWYPEEERERLEKKYDYLNEGSFSDLVFDEKYVLYITESK